MKASVVLPCLVVLCQFHGVLCDHPAVDRDCKTNERMKRYHETDCQKRINFEKKQNKTAPAIDSKHKEIKTVPQSVNKNKIPINERNQPKDVRKINQILEEIASLAHNHNETKGIHKIRHLVDEIDNLHKQKNSIKTDDIKSPKKQVLSNEKETKAKETNKLTQQLKTVVKIDPVKTVKNPVHIEKKDSMNGNKSLLTNGRRCYNEIPAHEADETTRTNDENLIKIEEHKYEEELLRSPCNTYNLNMAQNYNVGPTPNANHIENDNSNLFYPLTTYEQFNGNNEYYYANSPSLSSQPTWQNNNRDYTRCRKTWLDRNTVINNGSPNELGKIINEDRKELTSMHYPDYYRKYYGFTQKQCSRNNDRQNNSYWYYLNP